MVGSLRAQWLGQASQGHKMFCHYPGVVGLNSGLIKPGMHSPAVLVELNQSCNVVL